MKFRLQDLTLLHAKPGAPGNSARAAVLEKDAALSEHGQWNWIDGRQKNFYLITP